MPITQKMSQEELLHLEIKQIIAETADACTYILQNVSGTSIPYEAGQFLTLLVNIHNKALRRSYSLCSTPGIDKDPAITIKRKTNGSVSRYLLDNLKEGDRLISLLPAGRFTFSAHATTKRDIFLLAAGSGITPVFSLLKKILQEEPESHVVLIYSNARTESIIYKDAVSALAQKHRHHFECIHILSHDAASPLPHINGHLNNQLLGELVLAHLQHDPSNSLFLLCGPPAYMRMITFTLLFMGFADEQIRKENFIVPEHSHVLYIPHDDHPHQLTLHYKGEIHSLSVLPGETMLDAALRNNIRLPYSCKGGVCSTCTARCISGRITMSHNEVLTDSDMQQGLVLTCVGYILSDTAEIKLE